MDQSGSGSDERLGDARARGSSRAKCLRSYATPARSQRAIAISILRHRSDPIAFLFGLRHHEVVFFAGNIFFIDSYGNIDLRDSDCLRRSSMKKLSSF